MSYVVKTEILRPDKPPTYFDMAEGIYSIGSDEDCKLIMAHSDIADRHAILSINSNSCWIEDLGSENGTFVNQHKVQGRSTVMPGDKIEIGPFTLIIDPQPEEKTIPATDKPPVITTPINTHSTEPPIASTIIDPLEKQKRSIRKQVHEELIKRMELKRLVASHINQDELKANATKVIRDIISEVSFKLPAGIQPEILIKEICDEALGLGPLEGLLADPQVTEIMVNGHENIYVEQNGKLIKTNYSFLNNDSVAAVIERIVSPLGRRIDESQPYVDARLPNGSRVNAIIHPLSLQGPCLTIRKFSDKPFTKENMINFGTFTEEMARFIDVCVQLRKNIIISGGTGSGKTTLLNITGNFFPPGERIVTIEDAAELRLKHEHIVRLEARPANIEGKGAITIRDLVRNSLRMRPDRIVVGECRGGEALDMLQAMNTGHDGSLTTVHANTPRDVISRLETMVLMSGLNLPVRAIREQIASAVDVIVHESRFSDGSRKVTHITEVVGLEGDQITMQDIFEFRQTGIGTDGKVIGGFVPTGAVPTFIEEIASRGLSIDHSMFDPQKQEAI
jgi:pilus assembly protein CpaF